MAIVTSRVQLQDHALRRLGAPVIEINVDEDQIDDRIDDALQYYAEFHSDAVSRGFHVHLMTATDITNEYITLPTNILYVIKALPIQTGASVSRNFFSIKYQLMLQDVANQGSFIGDLGYFTQMQQYLSLLESQLTGTPQVNFRRHQNRLKWFSNMNDKSIKAGDYVVLETDNIINPETFTSVYNDMFVKDFTTQLIKQQWGANLIKFEGMQLPGGVLLNGRQLYDDATAEIATLKETMRLEHEFPPDFFVG
jgi:hypothetical protein|tara:strand:+ start:312 stop:1067 length:756 start_codon:yes stop_codon:yes gene_type:complete